LEGQGNKLASEVMEKIHHDGKAKAELTKKADSSAHDKVNLCGHPVCYADLLERLRDAWTQD